MSASATNAYNDIKKVLMDAVNDDKTMIGQSFKFLEEKTGCKRAYLLLGFIAFLALYLVVGYGTQFLSNILGFIYPAYASMTAIETPDSRDDTKWLTYWVVFSLFAIIEYPLECVLQYIPFYFLIKCLYFAWLYLPVTNGATILYKTVIRPFFLDAKKDINDAVSRTVSAGVTNVIKGD